VKLGLISDVHGDPLALELAWSHLTVLGADQIICAGDLVGYGPFPDRVATFFTARKIPAIRGNHDRWALRRGPGGRDEFGGGTPGAETLAYLESLPRDRVCAHDGRIAVVVHGSPRSDMEFVTPETHPADRLHEYLTELTADLLVMGHTHVPAWHRCERGLVVNPGSVVSMPVVKTSRTFALVDMQALAVTFHDVETGSELRVEPWPA
jgi:putative phosphoesterase